MMKNRSVIVMSVLLLVFIFTLAMLYFDKVMPLKQTIELEKTSLQTKEQLLKHYQNEQGKESDVQKAAEILPEQAKMAAFLINFNQLLKTDGVTLQTMSENEKSSASFKIPDNIASKSYKVTLIAGNLQKMQAFLDAIEQLNRFVTIDTLNLVNQPHQTEAIFDMTIYWKE